MCPFIAAIPLRTNCSQTRKRAERFISNMRLVTNLLFIESRRHDFNKNYDVLGFVTPG